MMGIYTHTFVTGYFVFAYLKLLCDLYTNKTTYHYIFSFSVFLKVNDFCELHLKYMRLGGKKLFGHTFSAISQQRALLEQAIEYTVGNMGILNSGAVWVSSTSVYQDEQHHGYFFLCRSGCFCLLMLSVGRLCVTSWFIQNAHVLGEISNVLWLLPGIRN